MMKLMTIYLMSGYCLLEKMERIYFHEVKTMHSLQKENMRV